MSALVIGTINQSRSGSTVTLTFTAAHDYGIHYVRWIQYASNGTSVLAQGNARMVWNITTAGSSYATMNLDNNHAWMDCTVTIPNATASLYVILSFYTIIGQRHSRRIQLI